MTEISEVKTIGEVERIVHGSDMWDGTDPVEFSDDGVTWTEAWTPTSGEGARDAYVRNGEAEHLPRTEVLHPTFARVTVYRKGVRVGTRVTIRWDEQRPRENEEWAAKWDAAPTRHFGRTARMVAFRQTFRDILGDIQLEDEERGKTEPPVERDWSAEIEAATTLEQLDEVEAAARKARVFTPDTAGTTLHRQVRAKRKALTHEAWKPVAPARPAPQDHLPGNRAERRARTKKKGRR